MMWAEFYVIETMADPIFSNKRIAYSAAFSAFSQTTRVLTLATNQFKKDLASTNFLESALALHCLAHILTAELAIDLVPDFVFLHSNTPQIHLLSHSRSHIRKRAVLVLYKTFLKFPASLPSTYPKLKDMLNDPDMGVVGAAVNVICELSLKDPKDYLTLAPTLFDLLTRPNINNNWLLIKIVKLVCCMLLITSFLHSVLSNHG
jgi:AP-3 complex subunit delta-1